MRLRSGGIIRSASAGVGFQKDSLRPFVPPERFMSVQGYRSAHIYLDRADKLAVMSNYDIALAILGPVFS